MANEIDFKLKMIDQVKHEGDREVEISTFVANIIKENIKNLKGKHAIIKTLKKVEDSDDQYAILDKDGYNRYLYCVHMCGMRQEEEEGNKGLSSDQIGARLRFQFKASADDDGVLDKPSLELRFKQRRFWFCMSNMAYPKYGYGVLKV
ncbi:hypothetical protein Tco_1333528 [Tanacetum coccineum]